MKKIKKYTIEQLLEEQVYYGSNDIVYIETIMLKAAREIKKLRRELKKSQRNLEQT